MSKDRGASERVYLAGGPKAGFQEFSPKCKLVRLFGPDGEILAVYARTTLSLVDHDTAVPIFKCLCK